MHRSVRSRTGSLIETRMQKVGPNRVSSKACTFCSLPFPALPLLRYLLNRFHLRWNLFSAVSHIWLRLVNSALLTMVFSLPILHRINMSALSDVTVTPQQHMLAQTIQELRECVYLALSADIRCNATGGMLNVTTTISRLCR